MQPVRTFLSLIALIAVVSFNSCKSNSNGSSYMVTGIIKHAENQKLLLQEVPYGGKPIITLDSVTIGKDGKYYFFEVKWNKKNNRKLKKQGETLPFFFFKSLTYNNN